MRWWDALRRAAACALGGRRVVPEVTPAQAIARLRRGLPALSLPKHYRPKEPIPPDDRQRGKR